MARKTAAGFATRDDMKQKQIEALIAVLQVTNPEYNVTLHEAEAVGRILRRWGLPIDGLAAEQQTGQPAAVGMRFTAELKELGVPDNAPLYYHFLIGGNWHEIGPLKANILADGFDANGFAEVWSELVPATLPTRDTNAALMNLDGRRPAAAVSAILQEINREEFAKIPA